MPPMSLSPDIAAVVLDTGTPAEAPEGGAAGVLKDAYIEPPEDKDDTGDKSDVPPVEVKNGTGRNAIRSGAEGDVH